MNNEILPNDYRETLSLIIQKIHLAQQKAVISANITLLDLYWEIGNVILNKKKQEGWGAKVIENLSRDITSAFPGAKGYSSRNLKYMSQFAKTYSNYLDVKGELSKVSWSHNIVLMSKVKDETERTWYINETIKNGWGRSVLIHQIEYGLYNRSTTEEKTIMPSEALTTTDESEIPAADSQINITNDSYYGDSPEETLPETDSRIVVKFKGESWFEVRDDAKIYITGIFEKGYIYNVPNQPGLRLSVGRYYNVDIYIDGKLTTVVRPRKQTNVDLDPFLNH